jgi:hypothetical protein
MLGTKPTFSKSSSSDLAFDTTTIMKFGSNGKVSVFFFPGFSSSLICLRWFSRQPLKLKISLDGNSGPEKVPSKSI